MKIAHGFIYANFVIALLLLTAMANGNATVGEATGTSDDVKRVELIVKHRKVLPSSPQQQKSSANSYTGKSRVIKVTEGDVVELVWSSDEVAMLHLHGYNIMFEVTPEKPTSISFRAHATGRFPVIGHSYGGLTVEHYQAILYLEVYPK